MSILLIVSLTACGSQNADHSGGQSGTLENLQSGSGNAFKWSFWQKTLVVYYSATENTKKAAEHIASVTGGDLFELVPVKPYSREDLNWNDENSRVVYEYEPPRGKKDCRQQ